MNNPTVLYARFSPRPGAETCESCLAQLEHCRSWASLHSRTVTAEHQDDGASGASMDRPGLLAAVADAKKHRAALVVYSLSRFGRSLVGVVKLADELRRAGAQLVSIRDSIDTTSASGRLQFNMLAALAQYEREITAERTSDAMIQYQASGRRMSAAPPFGWSIDPKDPSSLTPHPEEQEALSLARSLAGAGSGPSAIARALDEAGYQPRGSRWHRQTVARMLSREMTCGSAE